MKNLIKAEIEYTIYKVHIPLVTIGVLILYSYLVKFNPLNIICFIILTQYSAFIIIGGKKENREYKFQLLNVSNKKIALSRIVIIFIAFIPLYCSGIIIHLLFELPTEGFRDSYLELVMFGGIGLMSIFTYLFLSDIFSNIQSKSGVFWFNIIVTTIIIIAIVLTASTIRNAFNNPSGKGILTIIFLYLACLMFAMISFFTYKKKESYIGIK